MTQNPTRWRSARGCVLLAATLLALAACDTERLLQVDDPHVATPETLQGEQAIPTLVAGVIGDFAVAYNGEIISPTEGMIPAVGLFTDEYRSADTFDERREIDSRNVRVVNLQVSDFYLNLHNARAAAERVARQIESLVGADDPRRAEVLMLAGYVYVLFAENFCSGVPVSEQSPEGDFTYGEPQTTAQSLQAALARFDAALAAAGDDAAVRHAAQVGRGRALLNLGRFTDAAAAVASVPTEFTYWIEHSANSSRQENTLWNLNNNNRRWTMADREGGTGLPFRSENDSRVPFTDPRRNGFDRATRFYAQLKYPDRASDVPLAEGVEARLIEAEAALQAGDAAGWLQALNALRAGAQLPAIADPGTATARVDLHFRERAYWLFSTAHRLGDLRRLIRQYGRAEDDVFPTGAYHKGGTYGDDVNFPIPVTETNNPNFTACLDRRA